MATQQEQAESLALLDKLGLEEAEKFVHRVVSDICDKDGLHYEEFAKLISLSEYSQLKLSLCSVLKNVMREKIEKDKVIDKLKGLNLNDEMAQVVAVCLWVRREEIRGQMIGSSCNITHSHLNDFDWRLKLVMSSDQLGSIQEPVVMVDFDISKDGQHTAESVELSKEELDGFVASLEAANKVVSQLRA
ncbi:COMM domain-containing protein 8-like [Halichondria panicea]|uniref:COMM domain-containing protein 8-like n=1 Tax=Halichondria panicea TaxID=6063 RepID=UPI00312B3558